MKVKFAVVDSGPIIKNCSLETLCEHAVIVPGVIREIKDLSTRERIRNLPPYFFSIQVPSPESIKYVKSVASRTGDIKVLSDVDIEVLAMAYELKFNKTNDQIENMFELLTIKEDIQFSDEVEKNSDVNDENSDGSDSESSYNDDEISSSESEDVILSDNESMNNIESDFHQIESNDSLSSYTMPITDDDSWITPENFEEKRKTNFGFESNDCGTVVLEQMPEVPLVGCLTIDYAMQNILLHMNVTILSMDGMVIKEPRIFISYCRGCFHKYKKVDLYFCPHCGNSSIGKVPAKISENGEMELYLKKNFQPNLRNKIFSIPTPKGGKHTDGTHYIYCADQRVPDERLKKKKVVIDISEEGQIPFIMHDFTTKSSLRGLSQNQSHNLRPSVPKGNKKNSRRRK